MSAPVLVLDTRDYVSSVAFSATADGVYVAKRLPIPTSCTCGPLECDFCRARGDHDFTRSQDI